uniref:hypothetical protein n=1 Tax=Nocardia abscessus TaxID=120957 RepID=UPI0024584DEA
MLIFPGPTPALITFRGRLTQYSPTDKPLTTMTDLVTGTRSAEELNTANTAQGAAIDPTGSIDPATWPPKLVSRNRGRWSPATHRPTHLREGPRRARGPPLNRAAGGGPPPPGARNPTSKKKKKVAA